MKSRFTIQSRILRAVISVVCAVFLLSGLSIYAIVQAQKSAKQTNAILSLNNQHFLELRLSLEQTTSSFDLIGASKGAAGLQHLEVIRRAEANFMAVIDQLEKLNEGSAWQKDISQLRTDFKAADAIGRETALAFVEGNLETAAGKQEILTAKLDALRKNLQQISKVISAHVEASLQSFLLSLVVVLLPVALLTLILPPVYIFSVTKKIDRELSGYVEALDNFTEQNDLTSENLKVASQNLSGASAQQSAAVQESVASIAEIRSMLSQTANHVREVQGMTSAINDKTHDGSQIMNRMENSMVAIEQANSQLESFQEIILAIKEKTQIINDIVFKTQLLSFNASIEAARAGQYGRGFAVVAEEVGKLAHMSGGASKEIDQLLLDSQRRVVQIVETVQSRVRDGKEVSEEALKRFNEIAKQVVIVSDKVNQVGEATIEQEGGVEQTARAMDQMDETAAHNKDGADQIYKISIRVRELSVKVREVTGGLSAYVSRGAHPSGPMNVIPPAVRNAGDSLSERDTRAA